MSLRLCFSVCALFLLLDFSSACFSSGLCGGGGGCCGGGGGGCMPMPPPPPPVCGGGCSRGYGCGSYGCFKLRARARSSKTLKLEEEKSPEELARLSPDEKFQKCCEERNLPDPCMSKCTYRTYTRDALQSMYFKTDSCPMQAAADIHFCAAQGRDHTDCCSRNGVATTLAGPKCMTFCDQRPGNVTQLDMTYLACYDRFENMKSCFWYDMTQGDGARLPPVTLPTGIEVTDAEENRDASHLTATRDQFAPNARTFKGFP